MRFRHVTPGQGGELGVQAGLVALDDQQVVRAAPGQVGGVLTLGVQSIGGDDRTGDVQAVQQLGEQGDLVGSCRVPVHAASVAAALLGSGGVSPWRGMNVARFLGHSVVRKASRLSAGW
jgi:hypothetical protein